MKPSTLAIAAVIAAAAPMALASTASEPVGWVERSETHRSQTHRCTAVMGFAAPSTACHDATPCRGPLYPSYPLKGMDAIKAIEAMSARGFTNVDTLTSGDTLYGIYYNAETHQCVQLANAKDRVDSAVDIHTHPKCR